MNGKEKIIPCDTILPVQLRQKHYAALIQAEMALADANDAAEMIRDLLQEYEQNDLRISGLFGVFGVVVNTALEEVASVTYTMQLQMEEEAAQ